MYWQVFYYQYHPETFSIISIDSFYQLISITRQPDMSFRKKRRKFEVF